MGSNSQFHFGSGSQSAKHLDLLSSNANESPFYLFFRILVSYAAHLIFRFQIQVVNSNQAATKDCGVSAF